MGTILAGRAQVIELAHRTLRRLGGASVHKAGIAAAAALVALDTLVERLADDHRRARRLAEGLAEAGLSVDPGATESNFVAIDVRPLGLGAAEAATRIADHGVLVSTLRPGFLRAVTYRGIGDEDVERALEAIPRALRARVRA
jgi:threonine aldolase